MHVEDGLIEKMRILEVRRHAKRVIPGQHLSQEGVNLARQLGENMAAFDLVITSTVPRAYETAIAMGYAVDEMISILNSSGKDVEDEVTWDAGFEAFAQAIELEGATTQYAGKLALMWRSIMETLPEGGQALIITHGGIVEAGAVACLPDSDHSSWGSYCDYCEGVRLYYENGDFVRIEILRVKR